MAPEMLQADNLTGISGLHHGFFTRNGGVSEGIYASLNCGLSSADEPARIMENRRRVAESLAIEPGCLLSCYQIHSPDAVTVTSVWQPADRPRADAMVTQEKGIALGVLTADCVPVLLADPGVGVIGAAHAGWRGALTGVIENTLDAMEKLGARKKSVLAALGPCIRQSSYEVGPEFPAPFLAEDPAYKRFFKPAFKSDRYMFDLPAYVEAKLCAAGVVSVEPPPADTAAEPDRFFSYRRSCLAGGGKAGSLISAIALSA